MNKYITSNLLLIIALILTAIASLMIGRTPLDVSEILYGFVGPANDPISIIVIELRLPRVLLGILIGATLGISGAALQGVLRNPLADPGVIGVTASASLGAVIAIHSGLAIMWPLFIPLFAMAGALIATAILLFVSVRESSLLMLILVGIGISSLAIAGVSLVMNMAESPMSVRDMVMWMLGSLENRTSTDILLALPFILFGWIMMINVGQGLNALSVGEDTAQSMGINISMLKLRVVIGSAISVGAAVAACGSIGFIGLVVPHMVRGLITNEPGGILIPSALMGGLLLTLADLMTRLPMPGATLQLGVVTSLIGAPAFLYIVYKTRNNMR
ncbi:FecCD family ABC transporter permease [Pseudemcibacter sp.]|uniref:FecCD family ABC transporter permease n=1 Tax=Pseudemcibacter sp. TaxID=2943293 RepID=UPI003F6978EF